MNKEQNKEIVAQFFKHFSAADIENAMALLDDTVVWQAMGREGDLPMSGTMDKQGISQLIQTVKDAIPGSLKLTPLSWTIDGGRVALEMESYGELTNGKIYNNLYHFLMILTDGKIASIKEYMDTYHVHKTFMQD